MAAQGKRGVNDLVDTAQHDAADARGPKYQGRRAAPKTRGIKLPVLSVPAIVKPVIGKPAVVASMAIAGIMGMAAASATTQAVSRVADGTTTDLTDLVEVEKPITVASSSADEAVMSAAEVLTEAAALESGDKAVSKAAAELEALLAEISAQADAEGASRSDESTASRSFSRSALSVNGSNDNAAEDESAAEKAAATAALSGSDEATDTNFVFEEEELGITVRSKGSTEDLPAYSLKEAEENQELQEAIAEQPEPEATAVSDVYVGKHAAKSDTESGETEAQAADSSENADNVVVVPTETEPEVVTINEVTLDSVVAATEKLRALLNGSSTVEVASAEDVAETQFEDMWTEALELTQHVGSYSNGQIPLSALTELETAPGQYLRADAALMFAEMNAAFKAEFGRDIKMTDSYRSYSLQVATKANKGWLAAAPGTSNHGWGLALDLSGPEAQWNTVQRNWLVKNSTLYGWITPDWAQSTKPEPWHWEYAGASVSAVGSTM